MSTRSRYHQQLEPAEARELAERIVRFLDETETQLRDFAIACSIGTGRVMMLIAGGTIDKQSATVMRGKIRSARWGMADGYCRPDPMETPDARMAALQARIDADQARRQAHVDHWLAEEQRRYGLPRRGRPLASMVA